MSDLTVSKSGPLRGRVRVPGDKSISHRTVLIGAIAQGTSRIRNFLPANDCLASLECVRALGVTVERPEPTTLLIHGVGRTGLHPQGKNNTPILLDCRRSGTTMRLLAGILAGQPFPATLTGDGQLLRRPMGRVAEPLRLMGATVTDSNGYAPLHIRGGRLQGIDYALPVASAQVKSAILLAGLFAQGKTTVREKQPTRDHTERLLRLAGVPVSQGPAITVEPSQPQAFDVIVPGDLSSAAFFLVAALLIPGSEVTLEGVGINPTRTGLLEVLSMMGAADAISITTRPSDWEPVADITVKAASLKAVTISGSLVPRAIDEFPILAVAATQAAGTTIVRDAAELRVKETDRIANLAGELRRLGAHIEEYPDGFAVHGPTPLRGTVVQSHGDHRLAMALAVAGLIAQGQTIVKDTDNIPDSFPGFEQCLGLCKR